MSVENKGRRSKMKQKQAVHLACIASKESAIICHLKHLMLAVFRERAARPQAHVMRSFSPETHDTPKGKRKMVVRKAVCICRTPLSPGGLASASTHGFPGTHPKPGHLWLRGRRDDLRWWPGAQRMGCLLFLIERRKRVFLAFFCGAFLS